MIKDTFWIETELNLFVVSVFTKNSELKSKLFGVLQKDIDHHKWPLFKFLHFLL